MLSNLKSAMSNCVLPGAALVAMLTLLAVLCSSCAMFGTTGVLGSDGALATIGGVAATADKVINTTTNIATLAKAPLADFGEGFQKLADATAPAADAPKSKVLTVINKVASAAADGCETGESWIDRGLTLIAKPAKILGWIADKLGK